MKGICTAKKRHADRKVGSAEMHRRKAKAESKFRFYTLYGRVMDMETLRCAWERVWKKDKALGVDGQTFEGIERGEGGAEGFLAGIQAELKVETARRRI